MNRIPTEDRYLTFVSPDNHNKYYRMTRSTGGSWIAEWGRIGGSGGVGSSRTCSYPDSQWDAKYAEKIRKGYRDISDVFFGKAQLKPSAEEKTEAEKEKSVKPYFGQDLIKRLTLATKGFLNRNYTVSISNITQDMVLRAEQYLDQMKKLTKEPDAFSEALRALAETLPRAISNTRTFFPSLSATPEQLEKVIERESAVLESMRNITGLNRKGSGFGDKDYPCPRGVKLSEVTDAEAARIRKMMGTSASRIVNIWKVKNSGTDKKLKEWYEKNEGKGTLLFHGSRTENFLPIISNGLILAKASYGMFGKGIYFAPEADKSIGYTSISGSYWRGGTEKTAFLAVYEVAMGKHKDVYSYDAPRGEKAYNTYDGSELRNGGYDSLWAHGHNSMLRRDECIIYDSSQCSIRYLIEFM